MTWPTFPLGRLCNVVIGATPARKELTYWGGDNVWVTISELNDNSIFDSKEHISDLGVKNSASKLVCAGTLLFGFKLSIGKMAFAGVVGRALAGKWRQECKCRPTTDPDDTSASSPITESS